MPQSEEKKSSQAKHINLPSTTYQLNEIIKAATSPFSSSSKRKYSPWKSPLSRTKTFKAIKYSPLTKNPKPRPARALFELYLKYMVSKFKSDSAR